MNISRRVSHTPTLDQVLTISHGLAEYSYLETESVTRCAERDNFCGDKVYVPTYHYPRLQAFINRGHLNDGRSFDEMRTFAGDAIGVLERAYCAGEIDADTARLFRDFYANRLQRLLMLKTAQQMTEAVGQAVIPLRHRFARLNAAIYGDMDEDAWLGIMKTERDRLEKVSLPSSLSTHIVEPLQTLYAELPPHPPEIQLVDRDLVETYQPLIQLRYAHILNTIPRTGPETVYDAEQCSHIMQTCLRAGGFHGWRVRVDPRKINPSTDRTNDVILLPANTRRTAAQLRRLIMHEQEVHARRAVNGSAYESLPLLTHGTADYGSVEEGLGIFLEVLLSGSADSPAIHRARERYITAGLALGVNQHKPRDARQTYELLWRIIAVRRAERTALDTAAVKRIKQRAYAHIENAFRGTSFAEPGLIYRKLKVYYEGLAQNVAYFRSIAGQPVRFDDAFLGKYNHTNARERQMVMQAINNRPFVRHRHGSHRPELVRA